MKRTVTSAALAGLALSTTLAFLAPAAPASAGTPVAITGRASTLPGSAEPSTAGPSADAFVSGNGRFVTFSSSAAFVSTDTNGISDVYVKDLLTDSVELISATYNGNVPNSSSRAGAITPDGRYVAFWSYATNLVAEDSSTTADVFVRDRQTGTTQRVSVTSSEQEANGSSPGAQDDSIDLSSDGRYVAFSSTASNLGSDADTVADIFVRDRTAGTTELISVNDAEASSNNSSYNPSITADGRYVAFESDASNLVASDTNSGRDVFVRDRTAGTIQRVSVHDNEGQAAGQSFRPWIDDTGVKIAFASNAKLNGIDANSTTDVYVRNRSNNTTTVASVGTDGWAAGSSTDPTISGDGNTVAFQSTSPTALAGGNAWETIYTRSGSTTTRVSVPTAGTVVGGESSNPSLATDGSAVAYDSKSSALVTNDTNGVKDVFVRRKVSFGPYNATSTFAARQAADFGGTTAAALDASIRNGASPEHALVDLAHRPAFAGKRPALIRLYVAYFKRMPDLGGMNYWLNKLNNGTKLDAVSAQFAASSEFKTKYGNTTNTQFVKLVYGNVFNRQPDASGLAYWVKKLDQGMSRGTVLTNFSESSEGQRRFAAYVNATLLGLGMIGKLPTGNLLVSMLDVSNGGSGTNEHAARVLLNSAEYAATA